MCGRYARIGGFAEIEAVSGLLGGIDVSHRTEPDLPSNYNISPTGRSIVLRLSAEGKRELVMMQWGILPPGATNVNIGFETHNARMETVATRRTFSQAFRERRCIVPASGFYEWDRTNPKYKKPYWISPTNAPYFIFTGLWEPGVPAAGGFDTFTLVTSAANAFMAPLHDRIPVQLSTEEIDAWLDPRTDESTLHELMAPREWDNAEMKRVSRYVNSGRASGPTCITPLEDGELDPFDAMDAAAKAAKKAERAAASKIPGEPR